MWRRAASALVRPRSAFGGQRHSAPLSKRAGRKTTKGAPEAVGAENSDGKNAFSSSLNLPTTSFPMRANAAKRELERLPAATHRLFAWQVDREGASGDFVLHDGPPYANGELHTGHFMNKVLKDMINRHRVLRGDRVHYVPGWDCHGLPIEVKALEAAGRSLNGVAHSAQDIRALAYACAKGAIAGQQAGFERWGVMAGWDRADGIYTTMDRGYEARQLEVFELMVQSGLVRRGLKPVYWSYSSGTALAEAEIEYESRHESPSCYVDFELKLPQDATAWLLAQAHNPVLVDLLEQRRVLATIWTTTPWTLLSNVAIAVHPDLTYCLVTTSCTSPEASRDGPMAPLVRLIARDRVEDQATGALFGEANELLILGEVSGRQLEGLAYVHPLERADTRNVYQVVSGTHVSAESGTGLVHTAPAHGQDDLMCWRKAGGTLEECPCPIDDQGRFFAQELPEGASRQRVGPDALWSALQGRHIHEDGEKAVLALLDSVGALPFEPLPYFHRYPYDWRTKRPVITRATEQWFVNLTSLKPLAARALEDVQLVPASSRTRLSSMLQGRDEWCISRQRVWGVPIPALFASEAEAQPSSTASVGRSAKALGGAWLDHFVVRAARERIAEHGTDWWFAAEDVELVVSERANQLRAQAGLEPKQPGRGRRWVRGRDTLDVWFDSGCSWNAVLGGSPVFKDKPKRDIVADVYLEGSDQHRGWFQSSLLTKLAATVPLPTGRATAGEAGPGSGPCAPPRAPFKHIITHGFLLDEHENKMSKSAGNVVLPGDVIEGKGSFKGEPAYGVDVLRLWVASTDYTRDVLLGKHVIKDTSDSVRKIRNVLRFLLGNLNDFGPEARKLAQLPGHGRETLAQRWPLTPTDRLLLDRTARFVHAATSAYDAFKFRGVYSELMNFVSNDLSALYSTCAKDRLYCDAPDAPSRRASQAVLWEALQAVTLIAAPVLCFTAEEVHQFCVDEVAPFPAARGVSAEERFSVFQSAFPDPPESWLLSEVDRAWWTRALELRGGVNRMLGELRSEGHVQTTEQVAVVLRASGEASSWLRGGLGLSDDGLEDLLTNLLLVSSCRVVFDGAVEHSPALQREAPWGLEESIDGVDVALRPTEQDQCERCRRYVCASPSKGEAEHTHRKPEPQLCGRCASVALHPTAN